MDTLSLLTQAMNAGLTIDAGDDGKLTIKGPKSAEELALALLDRKPAVIAALVTWKTMHTPRDIEFHDELAAWDLGYREAWGRLANMLEELAEASGTQKGGEELGAFAKLAELRQAGISPNEALAATWEAWSFPGDPPRIGSALQGDADDAAPVPQGPKPPRREPMQQCELMFAGPGR
jgi:hypothetical protein